MVSELGQISIYLAKPDETFDSVVLDEKIPNEGDFFVVRNFDIGEVSVRFLCEHSTRVNNDNPPWLDFVNEAIGAPDQQISFDTYSRRPNGLLLISIKERILAACFGMGGSVYLDKTRLLSDFGIKTAMNLCGNSVLRQTKSRTHAITTQHISRQLSRPSDSLSFGLGETELLQYISAHIEENSAITLQGKDSLTLKTLKKDRFSWDGLIEWCNRFLLEYDSDTYKKEFPNYPNFQSATEDEIAALDAALVAKIKNQEFDQLHLAIPEFIGDDEFSFSYTNYPKKGNKIYSHIRIEDLHEEALLNFERLDANALRRKMVYAYSHEDDQILASRRWSLYSCMVAENELGNEYFILSDGVWQKVDHDFTAAINEFIVKVLKQVEIDPAYWGIDIFDDKKCQNREELFNKRYCEKNPNAILFDKAKLKIGDSRKDKEFCDVLELREGEPTQIIQVKQKGGSDGLSYLFMQGRLYCESFLTDDVFLADIRDFIRNSGHARTADFLESIKEAQQDLVGKDFGVQFWLLYNEREKPPEVANFPLMTKYGIKLACDSLRKNHKYSSVALAMVPVQMVRKISKIPPRE
ncbi:MAG: DUF6119 family protein [Candidatus Azotimanducaceae bacterium WSBS_2022_MAG_OTU7]